ncbi:MAG: radical SAM protein [Candidatus Omnitrophota bacterium]|jgi:radical SAM superfamily enzyme YgiQ (UPF0313 family)
MSVVFLNVPPESVKERRYDRPNYPDPALGAIYSYLKGRDVKCAVIDSKLERLDLTGTLGKLQAFNPAVAGLTAFTHEIERTASAAAIIKNKFPGIKILIGGPHVNALPRKTLIEFPVFDIAVYGEGEETILRLIRGRFENLPETAGIAYRTSGEVIVNPPAGRLDMEKLFQPDWSVFPKARYYPVFTSRGCRYKCIFCSRPFGSEIRYRPLPAVIEEIKYLRREFKARVIYFWDENLCSDRPRSVELFNRMRSDRELKGVKWFCQTHVSDLDYELLKLMRSAGCIRIGIGIESGNEDILKTIKKGNNKSRIMRAVSWLKKAGIPMEGYFLLGLPGESRKTAMETIEFAANINPEYPVFGIVVPYPGTEICSMAERGEAGYRIISKKWRDYNKIIGKALELRDLRRKQLEILQFYGYFYVLVRNLRITDIVKFIFQFHMDIKSYIVNLFQRA